MAAFNPGIEPDERRQEAFRNYLSRLGVRDTAAVLVEDVLESACGQVGEELAEVEERYPNVDWPRINRLTLWTAMEAIDRYLATWPIDHHWSYTIDFLCRQTHHFATIYRFQGVWVRAKEYCPVPVTASVYFVLEASEIHHPLSRVQVKFFLETFKTPFVPGQVTIRTEWLSEVVERKTRLIRKIRDQWNKSRTHRPEGSRPTTAKTKLHIGPTREEMNILKNADLKIQGDESSTSSDSITTEGSSSHLAYHDSEGSESDDSSLSVFYEKRMWRSESWREECLRHRVHEVPLREEESSPSDVSRARKGSSLPEGLATARRQGAERAPGAWKVRRHQ